MSEVDRDALRLPFDELRRQVTDLGVEIPRPPLALTDRVAEAFRHDLRYVGVDVGDREAIAAAVGGIAVALKVMLQSGIQMPAFYARWVTLFDAWWPLITGDAVDLSSFEDVEVDWSTFCPQCLKDKSSTAALCDECSQAAVATTPGPASGVVEAFRRMIEQARGGPAVPAPAGPVLGQGPFGRYPPQTTPSAPEQPLEGTQEAPVSDPANVLDMSNVTLVVEKADRLPRRCIIPGQVRVRLDFQEPPVGTADLGLDANGDLVAAIKLQPNPFFAAGYPVAALYPAIMVSDVRSAAPDTGRYGEILSGTIAEVSLCGAPNVDKRIKSVGEQLGVGIPAIPPPHNHWAPTGELVVEEKTMFRPVGWFWVLSNGQRVFSVDEDTARSSAAGRPYMPVYEQVAKWGPSGWED